MTHLYQRKGAKSINSFKSGICNVWSYSYVLIPKCKYCHNLTLLIQLQKLNINTGLKSTQGLYQWPKALPTLVSHTNVDSKVFIRVLDHFTQPTQCTIYQQKFHIHKILRTRSESSRVSGYMNIPEAKCPTAPPLKHIRSMRVFRSLDTINAFISLISISAIQNLIITRLSSNYLREKGVEKGAGHYSYFVTKMILSHRKWNVSSTLPASSQIVLMLSSFL